MELRKRALMLGSGLALLAGAAVAQPEPSGDGQLEELIVVARKRAERLQDTPVAVTAMTGDQLVARSVQSLRDIQQQTPSLRLVQASTGAASSFVSIRGQTYADIQLTADPAVGIYVDGVYIPRTVGTEASGFTDIERVEVLKGAQGTLFGRNTTGGAISVFTKTPTDRFEGEMRARLGNYNARGASLVLNIPLGKLGFRMVAEQQDRDRLGDNLFNGGPLGDQHVRTYRTVTEWQPVDDLKITFRNDLSRIRGNSSAIKPVAAAATGAYLTEISREIGVDAATARARYVSYQGRASQDATLNVQPRDTVRTSGESVTIDWSLGGVDLRSITAQRRIFRDTATDLDASPFQLIGFPSLKLKDRQVSQELQLVGKTLSSRLDWIVGGFYSEEDGSSASTQVALPLVSANPAVQALVVENKSRALFGQATYRFSDQWSTTAGLRYTDDSRELTSFNRTPTRCLATGLALSGPCEASYSVEYNNLSYTLGVEFKPARDVLIYAKTNRAYRSGGLPNGGGSAVSAAAAVESFTAFRPEKVTDYELGLKSEWLDRTLRVNAAVFHTDYRDVQLSHARTVPGTSITVSVIDNIAAAKIDGLELETFWKPWEPLELRANLATTYARYTSGSTEPFRFTPKWSYSLSAAYTAETDWGQARAQVDYSWDSRIHTSVFVGRRALGLLNARASLRIDSADAEVAIFGRNLTNERYEAYSVTVPLGFNVAISGTPRTYGVELLKRF